jgi:hypothetical protein
MKHTPKEQEVLDYLVRQERVNFKQSGKEGIYPNTRQIELVFSISRQRANEIINELQRRLEKNLRQL